MNGETRAVVPEGENRAVVEALRARLGVEPAETLAVIDSESGRATFERAAMPVTVARSAS